MKNRQRLILFLESFKMGGAERQASFLAKSLKEEYELHLLTLDDKGELINFCEAEGISYSSVKLNSHGGKISRLRNALKVWITLLKLKPAIIVPFTYFPNLYVNLVWRLTSARVGIWNQRDEGRLIMGGILENFALKQATHVVSNSVIGADFLKQTFPFISRVELIRNAVVKGMVTESVQDWRQKLKVDDATFLAIMVANIHQFKDHETLIKSWAQFKSAYPEASTRLLIVGEDYGLQSALSNTCKHLSIDDEVIFLGRQADVADLLETSDLGILSTKKEGMPNAVLEYLMHELPVVATNLPDIETLLEGTESKIVPQGDEVAQGAAIAQYYQLWKSNHARFSGNREKVINSYTMEAMVNQYRQLFQSPR